MKKILLTLTLIIGLLTSCTEKETTTTYYLIRHAEKVRTDHTNKDPDLNDKGIERAKRWSNYFNDISLDAVYSTEYKRTMQTAKPTAESKSLEVLSYDPKKIYSEDFRKKTKGKNVLIVGHSNTTPYFANKILREEKYFQIDDDNNADLYVITVTKDSKTGNLFQVD